MAGGSKKAVYAALFGNLGIAVTKFVAAFFTGSASMWAESYHSVSDTFNQILLLVGIKSSGKAASERHQFGYGKEVFFWSFIVAVMLFGVSGILSVEQGFSSLFAAHTIGNVSISYVVLAISFVFEANALRIAQKMFKETIEARGEKASFRALINEFRESSDPTILTVIVEDSAALLGIIVAASGIFLSDITGNSIFDAISSLVIGFILMGFAFFLARENKGLLVGESLKKAEYETITELIEAIPEVKSLVAMRTMHIGSQDVIIGIEVNLIDGLDTDKIELVVDNVEQRVKQIIPYAKDNHIFVEIQRYDGKKQVATGSHTTL